MTPSKREDPAQSIYSRCVPDGATEEDDEMDDPGGPSPPVSWDWREVLAASTMTALGLVVVAD